MYSLIISQIDFNMFLSWYKVSLKGKRLVHEILLKTQVGRFLNSTEMQQYCAQLEDRLQKYTCDKPRGYSYLIPPPPPCIILLFVHIHSDFGDHVSLFSHFTI